MENDQPYVIIRMICPGSTDKEKWHCTINRQKEKRTDSGGG
jgi:hypothetical protein